MAAPTLIYCASGNKRFAEIAIRNGFHYGARLPHAVYFDPYFVDQDWKKPDRDKYMEALAKHRPHMATVLDLERPDQLDEVISWAEEGAQYVDIISIIPKYEGAIANIPDTIGGKGVRLSYRVPTAYGGSPVAIKEFGSREVHLLGGSPHKQMYLAKYMNVLSTDGNMVNKMARLGAYWQPGTAYLSKNKYWPQLRDAGTYVDTDVPYIAFELSCEAIHSVWNMRLY